MTKEEAIKRFETLLLHVDTDCVMGMETTEAINMAIKTLEQPEPCEDAVSREEVLNCLEWQYPDKLPRTKIMELPPVMPKQRTGKWITQDHNKRAGNISTCVYYYPICSKCGKVGIETYKYCPHCGAKMNQSDKTCDCYSDGRCIGTKEIDPCSCGGNKSKCNFGKVF